MRKDQSPLEDFADLMSKLPWWVNIILAFISYAVLHKLAMSFYDPAPTNLEVGKMGEYMVSKLIPSVALFGQFAMPFAFIMAGFMNVVKKFKRTREYKELLFYVAFVVILFGIIVSRSGGIHKSMMDRVEDPHKQETSQSGPQGKEEKIYTWVNEKGNKVYSNKPGRE